VNRYRWVVLAAGTVAAASMSAAMTGLAAIAPLLRSDFGLTLTQTGVVLGATGFGAVFTLLPWGLLADRIGERAVMAAGLAGAAAALGVAAAVDSFWPLVLLLALAGASGSSVNAASGRAVMGWFRPDERGLALGIRQTAIPIGGAFAAVTLPWIASTGGVPWAFVALAFGCVVGSLAGAIWLREPPREPVPLTEHARDPLRDRAMWLLSVGSWL
jgi:sugar phosphate permease